MRFNYPRSHATKLCVSEIQFSPEVSNAPEKLQLQFIAVLNPAMYCRFNQEALFTMLLFRYIGSPDMKSGKRNKKNRRSV
jgi:hypothetical protein